MIKKNRFLLAGLPVIALVWGMMVVGCDNGSTDDAQGGGSTGAGGGQKPPFAEIVIDGINSTELWNAAIDRINSGGNNKSYRLNITGSFDAAGVNDATFGTITGLSVEIRGQETANLKMSLRNSGNMLRIGTDQHLTLKDITLQGKTGNYTSLVRVYNGTLEMTGSAAVSGNTIDDDRDGGGVYISYGTMTMSGNAAISGNKAYDGGGVCLYKSTMTMSGNAAISGNETGGGVVLHESKLTMNGNAVISGNESVHGGGVYINDGTMTMNGNAAISGNSTTGSSGLGGGVYISYGTMTMSDDAVISGNEAKYVGGVVLYESTMTMNGNAAISGNTASSSTSLYSGGNGGGVYIIGGTMTMSGDAVISGNKSNSYGGGGGVCISGGTMTMSGNAAISGNTASSYGGGVYISKNSTMTMNDNAAISGNSATDKGGGVGMFSDGTFRMAGGTVYGNSETDASKKNTAPYGGASLYSSGDTAQYGTFNGGAWISNGSLSTGDNTIKVVNGALQP